VILKGGALAGVQGACDVSAHVDGLTPPVGEGEGVVIRGVEVDGAVWIGRRTTTTTAAAALDRLMLPRPGAPAVVVG